MAAPCRPPVPSFAAPIAVAIALLVANPVQGADKKSAQPTAARTSLLTPAQLRECLDKKQRVGKDSEAMAKAKSDLAATEADLEAAGTALKEEEARLDHTSADAVAAHNAKVVERNGRIDAFQTRVAAYNREAESVLAAQAALDKACANRSYDDRDLSDLKRKK